MSAPRPAPGDDHLDRKRRGLQGLLAVNVVLLVVNLGFMVSAFSGPAADEPLAFGPGVADPRDDRRPPPPQANDGGAPLDPVEGFLTATLRPLERAATEHNADLSAVLPSDEAVAAAARSGSLSSAESRAVLSLMEEGYARYNMPFPQLPPEAEAPPPPEHAPMAPTGTTQSDILRAYFTVAVGRVEREARSQGVATVDLLPDPALVDASIASGAMDSEASAAVLDALRSAHERLGVPFVEPGPLVGAD